MKRWILSISSAASILGLALGPGLPTWVRIIITVFGIACLVFLIFSEIKADSINEITCQSEEEIRSAMINIIKSQGKVCIMSRDLSWVNPEVSDCLKKKKDNLLIYAQKETELTKKLKEAGIQIRYYGDTHFEPQTRFTIIGYNKPTPQVAISRTQYTIRKRGKLNHKIYQTSMSGDERDMWINSLALDMIDLCELVSKEK